MHRALSCFASATLLVACSSVKVQTEFDNAANFTAYRTYAYLPRGPGPEQAEAARDARLREVVVQSIDKALGAKGFRKVNPDQSPDLLVAVHGFASNRIEVQSYGYSYAATPYGFYPGLSTPAVDVRQYADGTLIIDLIDAAKREMVWRGTAQDTFTPGAEAKAIASAVDKTFAHFPPPAVR